MSIYPVWFHALRTLMRPAWKKLEIRGMENLTQPSVFVTRHLNNYGPLAVYLFCPFEFHLWSYYAFLEPDAYYKHCSEYTFSQRMGLPLWAAKAMAFLLKYPATSLFRHMGIIPVYRGLKTVMKTMDISTEKLIANENVMIMTDVNYIEDTRDLKEMYTGFIHLGKTYYRLTGKMLNFTPLSINREEHYLRIGKPIPFDAERPYQEERDRVIQAIRSELQDNY